MATPAVNSLSFLKIKRGIWKLKTFLQKRWISAQDRYGWYRYEDWIRENETNANELDGLKARALEFPYQPVFYCLLDVNQASTEHIQFTLDALSAQIYPRWEVCCLNTKDHAGQRLQSISRNEPRLHFLDRTFEEDSFSKRGIYEYSDKLFTRILQQPFLGSGEFIFCLQAGDVVSPTLLYHLVEQLNQNANIDLFYTDEDHISEAHGRHSPWFKPDWSPELLYSINYLKFAILRLDLFKAILGKAEADTQYADLIVRCADESRHVCHIAEVLIHFLDRPPDEAADTGQENYSMTIVKRLQREGISDVEIKREPHEGVHLTWKPPQPLVSIIIPTKDHLSYIQRTIESIQRLTAYSPYELVIVDNESRSIETIQYYETLKEADNIRIVHYQGAFNFSKALNLGASQAKGDIFLFLNNDIQVIDADWLAELVRWTLLPEVGIVGARLLYPDGRIQHAGIVLGMQGHASHVFYHMPENVMGIFGSSNWYRNYSAVTGACLAMRRAVYDEIGGFDENYQLVFSDVAICLQAIQHGYRVVYNPFARLIHYEGRTRSGNIPKEDIKTGYRLLRGVVSGGDPFYNPSLSLLVCYPTFRRTHEEDPLNRLDRILGDY
ncbi:MAG: glycosyltransferase family 2 protein [Anaerolineaceae bacterium]